MGVDLNADQLAQFRGCDPFNDCYFECCQAAREAIEEGWCPEELKAAEEWAKGERWV